MRITSAALEAIRKTFSSIYQEGYDGIAPWAPQLAVNVPSANKSNMYGWLAKLPTMREWVGDRVLNNLAEYDYEVVNKDYELTIEVDRNDIQDDNLGIHEPKLRMMGEAARKQFDYLLVELLQNGHLRLCYDGQYFFDTDHPVSKFDAASGSQQNYWSSGRALSYDNYVATRAAMMGYLGEDGKPLGVMPDLLVVPPQLEGSARLILQADSLPSTAGTAAQTNVWKGSARLLVVPELANQATTWYLLSTSRAIKPFVTQTRSAPTSMELTDNSEHAKRTRKYIYGVDMRGAAGYGLWFLAAKCVA
ncbi:MAG: phage head protein [Rhodocyclaceae bacterium]|nr:MAG: phage head protein [Rhodocyclaceae bacterium]